MSVRKRPMVVHPAASAEINALPLEVRACVVRIINEIANYETNGLPLEDHPSTGDLSDCYKYYFDPDPDIKPGRYRLVYRLLEDDRLSLETVQAVAVGLREQLAVYVTAAQRLGRAAASTDQSDSR